MVDESKIEIVAKNFANTYFQANAKMIEDIIKQAYAEGFKQGVRKALEASSQTTQ